MCLPDFNNWIDAGGRIAVGAESAEVNLDYVAQRALERAQKPFHSPRADLPKVLRQDNLDYDKYREIRFRRDKAPVDGGPAFRIEFFSSGLSLSGACSRV